MVWQGSNYSSTTDYFYFSLIRKYVVTLGRQFSSIVIQRSIANNETQDYQVPLDYGPKDKGIVRLRSDPNLDRPYSALLPQMTYEITNIAYDANRKVPALSKNIERNANNVNKLYVQYAPAPYNIDFNLYIYVKNFDDGCQILEQIFPFFQPDFTPEVELIATPFIDIRKIPIQLHPQMQIQDLWDDDFKYRRIIIFTLTFTMRAYFFGPIKQKPVIKFVDLNLRIGSPEGLVLGQSQVNSAVSSTQTTITLANPHAPGLPNTGNYYARLDNEFVYVANGAGSANLTVVRGQLGTFANSHNANTTFYVQVDPGIADTIQIQPGLTANGQPTTNVAASVNAITIDINSDYGFAKTILPGNEPGI